MKTACFALRSIFPHHSCAAQPLHSVPSLRMGLNWGTQIELEHSTEIPRQSKFQSDGFPVDSVYFSLVLSHHRMQHCSPQPTNQPCAWYLIVPKTPQLVRRV